MEWNRNSPRRHPSAALGERRRFKDRFGGDIVYFLNDAASQECERLGLDLNFLAEISENELPRRRSLVVGMPDSYVGTPKR